MDGFRPGTYGAEPAGSDEPMPGGPASFDADQALLARYRAGDRRAFAELFERYRGAAFSFAYRYTSSQTEAQDIVSEAFTRILETMSGGKGPRVSMGHYLQSAVRSAAIRLRDKGARETLSDPATLGLLADEMWQREATDHAATDPDGAEWLVQAFNELDEQQRNVMWLRVVEAVPSNEIARQLSITPVAATRVYQRAMLALRHGFIDAGLSESPDPECRHQRAALRRLLKHPSEELPAHVTDCSRCQVIVRRLRLGERALIAGVIVGGGFGVSFAPEIASATTTATVGSVGGVSGMLAGASIPVAIWLLVAATLVAGAGVWIAVTAHTASPLLPSAEEQRPRDLVLGEAAAGEARRLVRVGTCEIERQPSGEAREIWSLNERSGDCQAQIVVGATGSTLIDTRQNPRLRFVEIAEPGMYWLQLSDGEQTSEVWVATL